MQRFSNRTILVTGAGSGIGQAAALRLAAEGATILALDLNQAALEQTRATIGAAYRPYQIDLTDPDQVRATIAAIGEQIGQIDGAFNAAGASGRRWGDGPVDQCSDQGWQRTLDVNLSSMFYVCRSVIPLLPNPGGAIVNLASVLGMVGGDEDFATHAYAAAKAGIIGMSRAMASTYASRGLRVNVVAPGLIATPMSQRAQSDPHILQRLQQLQPLTGGFGQSSDVAAAVAYLLSDDARFVTGVVLPVDGGWTMH